jgi:hypothetical protein
MHFTKSEYIEIKKHWLKTRKKQIKELGFEIYMYPFSNLEKYLQIDGKTNIEQYEYKYDPSESNLDVDSFPDNDETYTVFNVSTKVELWLLKNFKLECIKREVENQLSSFFYQEIPEKYRFNFVDDLDFSIPDKLLFITDNKNISLYFYRNLEKPEIETINKFLIYGTTDVFDIINNALKQINNDYNSKNNYIIGFTYCGLYLECNKKGIYYKNKYIDIPFLKPDFKMPLFKHSYNLNDVKKYKKDEIIISYAKDNIVNFDVYEEEITIKRALLSFQNNLLKSQIK